MSTQYFAHSEPVPPLKWSNPAGIPAIGSRVRVCFNGLGSGTAVGYFTEDGYLGVCVLLDDPPAWRIQQAKRDEFPLIPYPNDWNLVPEKLGGPIVCHAFGAEIKVETEVSV